MQPTAAVEVEVVVPCTEGQKHPIRLRIVSWEQWEVAYTPCEALLGRAFGLMAPCSHYVRENRDELKEAVVQQLARVGAPAVPALIQALGDKNEYVRSAAAEALGKIGDTQAVPALIQALGDSYADWQGNYPVRSAAAKALGKIGDAAAVPALRVHAEYLTEARQALQQLGKADYPLEQAVRRLAQQELWGVLMRALPAEKVRTAVAQLGTPAVPALSQALGDSYRDWLGNYPVRRAAAEALGKIGDAQAVPALSQALGDSDRDVRRAAAEALGQIGDMQAVPALIQALGDSEWSVRSAAAEALVMIGAPAVPALIQALGDSDWNVRSAAAEALGKIGDAQAVPALIQALGDSDMDVRRAAAEALGKIGDTQAVPALIQALDDSGRHNQEFEDDWLVFDEDEWNEVYSVRVAAAEALGQIGDAQAVPALIQALGDSDMDVRRAAAEALGKIGDAQAVPALIQALRDRNEVVRCAAAKALGQIGDTQAVPALIQVLGDRNKYVRSAAAEALVMIGAPAVPALRVHAEQLDVARQALQQLGKADYPLEQAVRELAQQELWAVLIRALLAEKVRNAVVQLGTLAVPALSQALGDRNEDVRRAAAEALVKIGTPAVPALIQALGDRDWNVRSAAAEALGKIGDAQAVPALIQALGDRDEDVHRAACEALVKIGAPAVPALIHALGDRDRDVRWAAAEALGAIGMCVLRRRVRRWVGLVMRKLCPPS